MTKRETIAVTGVSGSIGQVLLPHLDRDAAVNHVVGVDLRPPPQNSSKLSFHQLDVRDPRLEDLLVGVDTLVHLAFVLFRRRGRQQAEVDSINIHGTQAVCDAAARQGVRKLVILSSVMAYGLHPDNPIPLTEEMPLRPNPDNFYSRAKGVNAQYLARFAATHPEIVVTRLRPCTVLGPHAPPERTTVLTGGLVLLVRGFEPLHQFIHEEDVARAIHLVIQQDAPGIYNVAGDEPRTLRQLAEAHDVKTLALPLFFMRGVLKMLWWLGASPMGAEFADLARYSAVLSTEKLKALGWQPHYTTAQAYAALRAAYRP